MDEAGAKCCQAGQGAPHTSRNLLAMPEEPQRQRDQTERVRVARRAIQLDCAVVTTCLLAFSSFTGGNSGQRPQQKKLTNMIQVIYIFV